MKISEYFNKNHSKLHIKIKFPSVDSYIFYYLKLSGIIIPFETTPKCLPVKSQQIHLSSNLTTRNFSLPYRMSNNSKQFHHSPNTKMD